MLFRTKKVTVVDTQTPKATLDGYRSLQKTVRTIKDNLSYAEKDLAEYKKDLVKEFEVVNHSVFEPFTVVKVAYANETGVGISRRSETDTADSNRGYQIALGRAQKALIQKINKDKVTQREVLAG